jgi:hypothetical protein
VTSLVTLEMRPDINVAEDGGFHRARVDVAVMAISADAKVTDGGQRALELKLKPETRAHVQRHGIRTLSRLDLAPGRYQVRMAAREQGRDGGGSVVQDIVVPDYQTLPVAVSHLVLASHGAAQAMTTRPDPELKDRLPLPPTASREFDRRDTVIVFSEVYDNRTTSSEPIELVTSIADSSGKVVYRAQEEIERSSFEPKRKSWTHRLDVPLKDLAEGAYVLRVDARERGRESSAVTRAVPFSVRKSVETTP